MRIALMLTLLLAATAQAQVRGACEKANCDPPDPTQYGYGRAPEPQFQYGKVHRASATSTDDEGCDGYPMQTRGTGGPPGTVCRCTLGGPTNPDVPQWWAVRPGSMDGETFKCEAPM